jgi:acyl-CoA thioester hydrolase
VTDDFRHRTRLDVRLGDLDPFGHVNNAVIATYVEQGRVLYLRDVLGTGADPVSMPFILARLEIDYLSQTMFSDPVEVASRVDWIGRSSIHMSHLLTGFEGRELARSEAVLVAFDYATEKPMPVPDHWRATMAAFEGHPMDRPAANA